MSYASHEDMVLRFGETKLAQLTCRNGGHGAPDEPDPDRIGAALGDASETIDGYAAGRYRVPLSPVPAPVRRWCADMAIYYLYAATGKVPEDVRKAFEDALAGLKDMARGVIVFQCEGVTTEEVSASGDVVMAVPPRMFTRDSTRGF